MRRVILEEPQIQKTAGERDKGKYLTLSMAVLVVFLVLLGTLVRLQIVKTNDLADRARQQQDYINFIPGERGSLCDRNGVVLNKSIPEYGLALRIESIRDPRDSRRRTLDKVCEAVSDLASFLGPEFYRNRPTRQDALRHIQRNTPMPFVLWHNVPRADIDRWALARQRFPGTELAMSWKRHYEMPESAYHVRGVTGLERPPNMPFSNRFKLSYLELTGRSGMEEYLNVRLHGEDGYELLRADALSYRREIKKCVMTIRGKDVCLSIDIRIQRGIEKVFRENHYSGALVLLDFVTGEVLACVSEPCPVIGTRPENGTATNRVLAGYYPAGSTLKPFVAIAALETEVLTPEDLISCHGGYLLPGGTMVKCTRLTGHGPLDLREALARSCNEYFCTVGERLGKEYFDMVAECGGFGQSIPTELYPQGRAGIPFTPSWVREHRKENPAWTLGDSANASIGQGGWIITPMQLVVGLAGICTGERIVPTFLATGEPADSVLLPWKDENREAVLEGMKDCVSAPWGTGHALALEGVSVLGKTGTAQVGQGKQPHALVIGAFPADAPRFGGACIIEHGGGGGKISAPVLHEAFRLLLEYRDSE